MRELPAPSRRMSAGCAVAQIAKEAGGALDAPMLETDVEPNTVWDVWDVEE
jgi:hypothetical protein